MNTFGFLVTEAPGFALRGSQIKVLTEPAAFYNELCQRSSLAQKRITLSALYLGTGEKEHHLVDKIYDRVLQRDGLRVRVLLDYFRGNRLSGQGQSSCTMLQKLVQARQEMCQVSLFHTPVLRGLKKRIVPQKYNEMYGLQHTKLYIFDDSVIISGANLSQDYFTNRQDRYVLIKDCPELADYLDEVVGHISEFSFQMNDRCEFELHKNWHIDPSEGDFNEYVNAVQSKVSTFLSKAKGAYRLSPSFYDNGREEDVNTWIFPSVQMGIFAIDQDQKITSKLLETGSKESSFKFGTGYFNPTPEYLQTILEKTSAKYDVLMAHPKANGFFGASFPAGGIPHAYTLITRQFYERTKARKDQNRVILHEYLREGWTFHVKGIWHYLSGEKLPSLSMIGSPNFGYRSVEKDLEAQVTIVTKDERLRTQLHEEQERLFQTSCQVTDETFLSPERTIPYWVRFVVWSSRDFF